MSMSAGLWSGMVRYTMCSVFLGVVIMCGCVPRDSEKCSNATTDTLICDPNSTCEQFRFALNKLGRDTSLLLVVMNDAAIDPDRRRMCVRSYISKTVILPILFQEFVEMLRAAKWFAPTDLELYQFISGWLPISSSSSGKIYVIHVLPKSGGVYTLDVFFELPNTMTLLRFCEILKGGALSSEERALQISNLVLWDAEDKQRRREGAPIKE